MTDQSNLKSNKDPKNFDTIRTFLPLAFSLTISLSKIHRSSSLLMATTPNSRLGLTTLFLILIFIAATSATSVSDADRPTVFEILPKFGLPSGLLPDSVTSYTLQDDGSFFVVLEKACYIQFEYLVYYDKEISGKLSYGSISDLKGIQVQRFFFWLGVDEIKVDLPPNDSIYFQVGIINKKLDVDQFKTVHSCRRGLGSCRNWLKEVLELPAPFHEVEMLVTE
ncbi:hypothetical protein HS088_TW23G00237 [Tripterygium wilfordii]|uniref:Transmembrane protein n=1 Tax=Tripterygium wilfordii TaxID=458696 RepID=A0A7J7BUI3_TRIWF|nr:uncharacterized protein LOC119993300 [Tripterygium wilfordii]KAF5725514.1 hypothetical protein HS088_TW23G00237 [Tripterygium wilfordii]